MFVMRRAALATLVLLAGTSLAATAASARPVVAADAGGWMRGDGLRADPELKLGTLSNGLRYVIRRNKTPPGVAAVRLRINTGSLNEADDQRGLAHFLEHMVLNGTQNVPEGEFVRRLERAGLRFGPDTNASTSFGQTVFKLDLPQTDKATLDEAMFLLREVAGRATIDAAALDRERGIVLSEERARATPGYRMLVDQLAWLYPGQRLGQRLPIGTTEIIRTAPRQRLLDYYRAWYRPERATLVVVGDVDPADIERRLQTQFGDWKGVGPAGTPADQGRPSPRQTEGRVFVDPSFAASMTINWVRPPDLSPDSVAQRTRELEEQLAATILNRRLEKLAQQDGRPPFIAARVFSSELEETAATTGMSAEARLGDWRTALTAMDQEQRRLVDHGVTADEIEREVTGVRTALQAAVASASTRTSAGLAEGVVAAVDRDKVVTSPADRLAFYEGVAPTLTPARIGAAARRLFSGSGPLLYLSLPRPLVTTEAALAAYDASRKVAVTPPLAQARIAWPYSTFGTAGKIAERREFAEIGATHVRFANGVRLTVRPSAARKEQVLVSVRFGDGRLAMPADRPSPEWALGNAFTFGGTGKLDADGVNRALTGKLVGAGFVVDDDRFVLAGATRREDLPTQMQLLAAYVSEPGWRPLGWERIKSQAASIHDRFESSPNGVLSRDLGLLLRSGDKRWEVPSRTAMRASSIADARTLVDPALRSGRIEIIMAGDITVDQAIAQTAATFGALPARADSNPPAGPMVFPPPPAGGMVTLSHRGREDQAVGMIAWPTTGYSPETRQLARTLTLLGAVFQLRLTDELREKEGVSYAPSAVHGASSTWGSYGYLAAQVEAPPASLPGFFAAAQRIADDLASKPVDADELARARRPMLAAIERSRDGNGYWMGALEDIEDPFTAESIRTQRTDLEAVTPAVLKQAAARYLLGPKAFRIQVVKGNEAKPPLPAVLSSRKD
ncbi:M16 family metallopeptidase [Sphingomonas glaciei]|uniref:Insulinase family protein n=1 Tax=Sphingomonas glaciei TaxID=2938948 RepID=A0ABY5MXL0_9SPHN|nr:M16 family metallopeptidase [Sphingomonas glaciei]UUR08224.1 insulinase family protein [Sphingomonas glaciei]